MKTPIDINYKAYRLAVEGAVKITCDVVCYIITQFEVLDMTCVVVCPKFNKLNVIIFNSTCLFHLFGWN